MSHYQDSLPEMTEGSAGRLLSFIDSYHLCSNGYFYSVNHESERGGQGRVFGMIQKYPSLRLISRNPWWMRDGYVEEVYQKV